MKKRFLLLGILAAMFALTLPLYADPGGSVTATVSSPFTDTAVQSVPLAVEPVAVVSVIGFLAVVSILAGFALRRRATAIPWRSPAVNYLKNLSDNVRRNFAKLTKSPLLKHQALAA